MTAAKSHLSLHYMTLLYWKTYIYLLLEICASIAQIVVHCTTNTNNNKCFSHSKKRRPELILNSCVKLYKLVHFYLQQNILEKHAR